MLGEAVSIGGEKADTPEKLQAWLNMALVKTMLGKHREAARMEKNIYSALDGMPLPVRVNSYRQLAEINFISGDSLAGLRDILTHEQLADSMENGKDEAYLQELLVEYDSERLRQSNSILRQNVRMRGYMLYGSVVFAVLFTAYARPSVLEDEERPPEKRPHQRAAKAPAALRKGRTRTAAARSFRLRLTTRTASLRLTVWS